MNDKELKIYFNSACPVCNTGIKHQKNKMQQCNVAWVDIHIDQDAFEDVAKDKEFVRERLHVINEQGDIKVGIDAFIEIWKQSPHEKWKVALLSLPVIRPLSAVMYNAFAKCLYAWNKSKNHW